MRTFLKIFLFLLLVVVALIVLAPASLLDRGLDEASRGKWRLAETSGTLWNGSGLLTQGLDGAVLTPLRWRFEPSSLFQGAARWQLVGENSAPSLNGTLTFSKTGIRLDGLTLRTSAAVLQALLPAQTVQALEGALTVETPALQLDERGQQGQVKGRWQDAQLVLHNVPVDLGNVAFTVDSTPQGSHAVVNNDGGAVALSGDFQTNAAGKPTQGRLEITLRPDAPEALRQLLSTMAQPDAQGRYILEVQ